MRATLWKELVCWRWKIGPTFRPTEVVVRREDWWKLRWSTVSGKVIELEKISDAVIMEALTTYSDGERASLTTAVGGCRSRGG